MKAQHPSFRAAFTLVEILVSLFVVIVITAGLAVFMNTSMIAFAKNVSTNTSHRQMRSAMDRIGNAMNAAASQPILVSVDGTVVTSGSAAGIKFDEYQGGPYLVTHPGGTGITASTTTVTITRSVHELASPPIPSPGDVLLIDGSPVRLKVASASNGEVDANNRQAHTITLSSPAGTAIPWDNSTTKTASLVRAVAFVVIPRGARNELRYFQSAELVGDFSSASDYALVCNNIGTNAGDTTPFSFSTSAIDHAGRKFLDVALRIRARQFDQRLASKEKNNFSSAMQLTVSFAPKSS